MSILRMGVPLAACALLAFAEDNNQAVSFAAKLTGLNSVPSIVSPGTGTYTAKVAADGSIDYTLTFTALSTPAIAAHVHVGQRFANGGIMFFLCGQPGKPCPSGGGTVTGTVTAADIIGPTSQNVTPGDLATALSLTRAGVTYVNVHSMRFPAGEIRGQVHAVHPHGENESGDH